MTTTESRRFTKTATIKEVDSDERTATAPVLIPSELDHQFDFLRPDAMRRFHADDPDTGVLHSAFPNDAAELVRNEVIGEPEELNGQTFPAGTWIATRRYKDDELWELVDDGVLTGFSIGGEIDRAVEHDTLPDDIRVPEDVDEPSEGATELITGSVDEISDVDIPAVARATYKGEDLGKSLLDDVEDEAEFVELMTEQRGHDEDDARRLYQYLTDTRSKAKGDGKPGDSFEECVDIIMDERGVSEADAREICGALEDEGKHDMSDSTDSTDEPDDATKWRQFKSWLTGSDDDIESEDLGGEKAAGDTNGDGDGGADDGDKQSKDAPDGDTSDSNMTEDTDKSDEPPTWAKSFIDTTEENSNRIDELAAKLSDDDDGEADGGEKTLEDAPDWAKSVVEEVRENSEKIDQIATQSGHSQQLEGTEKQSDKSVDEVEAYKANLVGASFGGDD